MSVAGKPVWGGGQHMHAYRFREVNPDHRPAHPELSRVEFPRLKETP